jgi:hypothetical protein
MKVSLKVSAALAKTTVTPPIPLLKAEETAYSKGQYMTLKLRSVPTDEKSPVHEIQVPFFKDGGCEQFLEFIDKVKMVFVGQNLMKAPQKFAFVRTVLKGDALAHFEQACASAGSPAGSETDATFQQCLNSLTTHVFPQRALRIQKRYMRRYMRKPREMKMRHFRSRVVEMNNYLARFPAKFNESQKLDDEELMDLLEFAIPNGWQREMVLQGFDASKASIQELVEFCERLEFYEKDIPGPSAKVGRQDDYKRTTASTWQAGQVNSHNNNNKYKRVKGNNGQRAPGGKFMSGARVVNEGQSYRGGASAAKIYDPTKWCALHKQWGHDLNSCRIMLDQADKMAEQWKTVHGLSPKRGGAPGDRDVARAKKDGNEFKAMVAGAVKAELGTKRKAVDFQMMAEEFAKTSVEEEDDFLAEFEDTLQDFDDVKPPAAEKAKMDEIIELSDDDE